MSQFQSFRIDARGKLFVTSNGVERLWSSGPHTEPSRLKLLADGVPMTADERDRDTYYGGGPWNGAKRSQVAEWCQTLYGQTIEQFDAAREEREREDGAETAAMMCGVRGGDIAAARRELTGADGCQCWECGGGVKDMTCVRCGEPQ